MAEAVHRNALQPGFEVLWYRIERILGQGGFGITYLAYDTNLDQQVAIKEYLPIELAVREGDHSVHPVSENHGENFRWGLTRFIEEARTLAKFDHPNIVRVLSVFEQNNTAYMPMRYENGSSLQELLPRRGTLEEGQLMKILLPVLAGLRLVHEAGFVHRDIKPANIFIRDDGSPVLLDFGSARQSLGAETKTLTSLVSPGYAPFEQYYSKSDRQGPWTDLYGLGATMYRAVAGVPPMDAVDRSEGLLKNAVDPIVPVSEIGAGRYSRRFLDAIDQAIRFDEKARPQSAQEWLAMFEPPDPHGLAAAKSDSGSGGPGIALVPANTPVAAAEATAALTENTIPRDPDPGVLDATSAETRRAHRCDRGRRHHDGGSRLAGRALCGVHWPYRPRPRVLPSAVRAVRRAGPATTHIVVVARGAVHVLVDGVPPSVPVGIRALSRGHHRVDGRGPDCAVGGVRRRCARSRLRIGHVDGGDHLARSVCQCDLPSSRPPVDRPTRGVGTARAQTARLVGETRRHLAPCLDHCLHRHAVVRFAGHRGRSRQA